MVSILLHIRMPQSHYAKEIYDNVVFIIATVVKEVRDYLISPFKSFRKPETDNSSSIFPSQLPIEDEVNLKFKVYRSSLSTSSLNKKSITERAQAKKRKQICK